MKNHLILLALVFLLSGASPARIIDTGDPRTKNFDNISLEVSLKPFKENSPEYIDAVCRTIYSQWMPLLNYADTVSVMLWTADGSEILDYRGNPEQPLEWGKYIGNPNAAYPVNSHPDANLTLHERAFEYLADPPSFTYGDLKFIVETLKRVGMEITGKPVRVGNTFDPGPEFAESPFKYEKHPEICMANTMGTKSFVCCYATLDQDRESYAAYPDGIPQGTPLGTFLGRQSNAFLSDLGFDFLWLSNGFGFGMETWSTTGAVLDGRDFHTEKLEDVQRKIMDFWTLFRRECPGFRIETRGTNLSTGIDLASDGVDLRGIYNGGFDILPPPNSPWAALDGDYGLELVGYMSRMAELPDDRYLFRYYTHDPWWANSPWLDRYAREPHDIYLPMAVARINARGETKLPTQLNFLSVDDSYGNMPDRVPNEVIPHILHARSISPDEPGQVIWIYPFDEYHDRAFTQPGRIEEIFYGDWFIRQALNDGFPLNTVVSTTNFAELIRQGSDIFDGRIVVTVVPDAGSPFERELMEFVRRGGNAIVYGPALHAGDEFRRFLNIRIAEPLSGEFTLSGITGFDNSAVPIPDIIRHEAKWSAGGIETVVADRNDPSTTVLVTAVQGNTVRDIVVMRDFSGGEGGAVTRSRLIYVRGTNSAKYTGGKLLAPDDPAELYTGGSLMRYALGSLGYGIRYDKLSPVSRNPVNVVSRSDNGWYFAGFVPDQTVEQHFRFPQGAPVFMNMETEFKDGFATYRLPKSWNKECRIFVEQQEGIVSCFEIPPVEFRIKRKIGITGLKNATVRIYPGRETDTAYRAYPYHAYEQKPEPYGNQASIEFPGTCYEYRNIDGGMIISW